MPNVDYEVHITSPDGLIRLATITNFVDSPDTGGAGLDYVINVSKAGTCQLTLPASFPMSLLPLDARIGIWRSVAGHPAKLEGESVFLIRKWRYTSLTTTVWGWHANTLLARRIIDYYTGTSYTSKTGGTATGNLIKTLVNENMLAGISGANRIGSEVQADLSAYLALEPNFGEGASMSWQGSYDNLYDTVLKLLDASTQAGTYMAAEIVSRYESDLQLRTYATVRGVDHRAGTASPVVFSEESGTLQNAVVTVDRSGEVTFATVGGSQTGTDRLTATSYDATRIYDSPFNRIERFGDYSNISDQNALQALADGIVRDGRPRVTFDAELVETESATRGIHYDLGDLATALFGGNRYDVRLDVLQVSVTANNGQRSRVSLRSM